MESAGCVFLPAAGFHNNTTVDGVGTYGSYWSSTVYDANKAYGLNFESNGNLLNPAYDNDRFYGVSVRLVRPVE